MVHETYVDRVIVLPDAPPSAHTRSSAATQQTSCASRTPESAPMVLLTAASVAGDNGPFSLPYTSKQGELVFFVKSGGFHAGDQANRKTTSR